MKRLLVTIASTATAALLVIPMTAGAADLTQQTGELCLPERMEGTCEITNDAMIFPVVSGATDVTIVASAFTDNVPQREECSVVELLGLTKVVCTGRPGYDKEISITAELPTDARDVTVNIRHLAAADFDRIQACPWDEERPWLYQPVLIDGEIRACTPGSMHITVSAAFTLAPVTTVPVTTVPVTTVPVSTVAPPTTTTASPTTTVAPEPPTEVASETVIPSADPETLPVTGAQTITQIAVGVFAVALGATVLRWRRRLS